MGIKDGGSICYSAILYSVTDYHAMTGKDGEYMEGLSIKVLGKEIYRNTYYIIE